MSNAWTPGPWFIVTPTQGFEVCTIHGVEQQPTEDGLGQTWVYIRPESLVRDGEWHWPDEAECTANAHLIAAAPDLYAALDDLLASYAEPDQQICCGGHGCGCRGASVRDLAEHHARAALAKARGQA